MILSSRPHLCEQLLAEDFGRRLVAEALARCRIQSIADLLEVMVGDREDRREVQYPTNENAGTIVVDTASRFLYLVQENGRAIRYGIGVGKAGLEFSGAAVVQYKREWPRWTPTQDMIAANQSAMVRLPPAWSRAC